ncbi:DMT family transporter [Desulfonatronovibrio magnus]|uniref:DMT family transporter n=1 Tax=Desulfonatronovibrio magnus TaxID=698827 RepID=UPI0005EB2032|nr:DMT family transporter [Desulfonatronovibrio magnus]RQD66761.1 MAG: DMT family transporter [Desulfonatronovibrio sp. MSAO_Bac4]
MPDQKKAYMYALLTVGIWSTVASAFKISLRYLDHIQLLFYSCLTSTLVLGMLCIYFFGPGFWKLISRDNIKSSLMLGFLNPFLYYLVLFKAYDLLPAQEAQPLNYTWGITLALLSIPLLKQKITRTQILAIVISYSGTLIISTRGNILGLEFSNPLGVGLALGSTIIWALYWIYNTKDTLDPVLKLFLNFLAGLIYISIFLPFVTTFAFTDIRGLYGAIYVGVFEMGITFVFWLMALRFSRTTAQVSNLIYLSPFLSLIFIYFFVGETIRISTIVGLVLIMAGLIIQNRAR